MTKHIHCYRWRHNCIQLW